MGLLITRGNVAFFLISSMALGLPDEVQIFSPWYLIELLWLLTGLGLLKLWHLIYPRGISGQMFGLISSFLSSGWLRVVLDGNSSQEFPVSTGVPQESILGPTIFLLYINDLRDGVISSIGIYANDTPLYSGFDEASDL